MPPSRIYRIPTMDSQVSRTGEWGHGICGCFDNTGLCIMSFFCPWFIFGQNAKHVGEDCFKMGLCCMLPPFSVAAHVAIRGKIREKRDIGGDVFMDILYVALCPFCTLVQDTQEVHDMMGLTGSDSPHPPTATDINRI